MLTEADLFTDIVVLFVAAFLGGVAARALRLPILLGYLAVGAVVGPHALGLIGNVEAVQTLAELGVVLLLFAVGVEISFSDLKQVGKRVAVAGVFQLAISLVVGVGIGLGLGWSAEQSVVFGMVLSLSSTMVVLKALSDRGELTSLHGRVMAGVLVMQDLAFIPMIAVLPALSGDTDSLLMDLATGGLKAAAVLIFVFAVGGRVIPWLLRRVAALGERESFVMTVVAVTFGAAAVTQSMGLSAALGAFAAGLTISASDWTGHRALQEVTPLRDIFAALFFASLGMLTDLEFLVDNAGLVAAVVATAILVKFVLVSGIVRAVGYLPHTALLAGVGMMQIGEFSFILAGTADMLGIVDADFLPLTVVVAVVTMALTPGAIAWGTDTLTRLERRFPVLRPYQPGRPLSESARLRVPHLKDHVIIAGLGRVGTFIASEIERQGTPYIGIDIDPTAASRRQSEHGFTILGDSASEPVLEAARVAHAHLMVVAIADPASSLVTVQHARRLNPTLHIVVRVGWRQEADAFREMGVQATVWPELEAALEMLRLALGELSRGTPEVERRMDEMRATLELGDVEKEGPEKP